MIDGEFRIVIIHGSYGRPDENWFPWLAGELRKLGQAVLVPTFSTPEGQDLARWRSEFEDQVGVLDERTVLVGHSLGAGFIVNVLETTKVPIKGTFLVSGFLGELGREDFDRVNGSFVCRDFQWAVIRQNGGQVHVYNSDSDPYVPIEKGRELAERLGVQLTVIRGGGHINASAGFDEFPLLLDDIKELIAA